MYRAVAVAPTRNERVRRSTTSIRTLLEALSLRTKPRNRTSARPRQPNVSAEPRPEPRVRPRTSASAAPTAHRSVTGTLTTKVSRHDAVVSRPPRIAPAASPDAPTEPQTASALLRDGPAGNVVPMRP